MRRVVLGVLVGLLVVVLAAGIGGYWYARPLLLTGTGYAAHNACAVVHLAGRDQPQTDLPPNPLVPHLSTTVTRDGATTTIRGLLAGQTAWYTEGYGCTIADSRPALPPPTKVSPEPTRTPLLRRRSSPRR